MSAFSFVQITDHHLPEAEATLVRGFSPAFAFRAVMRHIAENVAKRIDYIVSTGDLVDPSTEVGYQCVRRMLGLRVVSPPPGPQRVTIEGLQEFPMYFMPGNHDERALFFYHLHLTTPSLNSSNVRFEHKGVQFICLDWGEQAKAVARPEIFSFLSQALETEQPSVILTHHHVAPSGSQWLDDFIADEVDRFWEILTAPGVRNKVIGVLSGHAHITFEQQVEGIPVFGLRSTAFPFATTEGPLMTLLPPHYRLVTIQNGILTTRIFEVPL